MRKNSLITVLTIVLANAVLASGDSALSADEANRGSCEAAVAEARRLAAALPESDASRYFAERYLQQAMVEAGNGEFDDCLELVESALDEVREHRHQLRPGEHLKVLGPTEYPAR